MSTATPRLLQQIANVIRTRTGDETLVEEVRALVLSEFESFVSTRVDEVLQPDSLYLPALERLGHTEAESNQRWCPLAREVTPVGKGKKDAQIGNRYTTDKDDFCNPAGCRCIASHCMAWRWLSESRGHCGLAGAIAHMPADEPRHLPNRMPPARTYPQLDLFDGAADRRPGCADSPPEAAAQELQMPTKEDVFPSKYLKVADLNGRPLTLEIKSAPLEALTSPDGKQESKVVLYFTTTTKKMPLNKTNFEAVIDVTGEVDSDNWPGHKVELYPSVTQMAGKERDCIRIRTPQVRPVAKRKSKPAMADDLDDEIGF